MNKAASPAKRKLAIAIMKVVHIVFEDPQPHGSGADLRNLAIGAGLARLGQYKIIAVHPILGIGKKYPKRKPSFIEANLPTELIKRIAIEVHKIAPDLIVVDGVFLADIARQLISDGHRVIVDMHNVESVLLKEIDQRKRRWTASLRYRKRWRAAQEAERHLAGIAKRVWVCSSRDAALLHRLTGNALSVDVVPNPVPAWCHAAVPRPTPNPWQARMLFVGHLGYAPNVTAARRLLRRIYPEIRKRLPDATLDICGRAPKKALVKLAGKTPGATLTINPPEVAAHYQRATVAVIPLSEGGGTRLKVLEAMAVGLPVIATPKAVEGLNLVPDETYLQAATDSEFADALHRLSSEPDLVNRLAAAGRQFSRDHHGPCTINHAIAVGVR